MSERQLLVPRDLRQGMEQFARSFDQDWQKIGFSCVVGYDPLIDELASNAMRDWSTFCRLPDEIKLKYHDPMNGGQRGFTPNGIEQSTKVSDANTQAREWREHFMFGPYTPDDHPLVIECAPKFYPSTPHVVEVPTLLPGIQRLMDLQEGLDLMVYGGLELVHGFEKGTLTQKLVYGDTSNRAHHYHKLPGKVIRQHQIDGVDAVDIQLEQNMVFTTVVRDSNSPANYFGQEGKVIRQYQIGNVKAVDIELETGTVFKNIVRAGKHTDVNWGTQLLRANIKGLGMLTRDGAKVGYTMDSPSQIVFNSSDYVGYVPETKEVYFPVPHWVGVTAETAGIARESMTRFTHTRTTADLGGKREGVRLWERLHEIGYVPNIDLLQMMVKFVNDLPSDQAMVERILRWEADRGKVYEKVTGYNFHRMHDVMGKKVE